MKARHRALPIRQVGGARATGRGPPSTRGARSAVAEPSLGGVLDFMRLLWAVEHGLGRASRRMERTLGLTGPQRLVVRLAGRHPGVSAGALARTLHVHPSTLTGVLRRLRERGVVARMPDPTDARRELYRLTSLGLDIDSVRHGTVEARIRAALAGASKRDVAAAVRVLDRIARALDGRGDAR